MPSGVYIRLSKPVGNRTNNKRGGRPRKFWTKEELTIARREKYRTDLSHREKYQARAFKRVHGRNIEEYWAQLKAQNNLCDACHKPLGLSGRRDPWDHDHETGKHRGIIHKHCNIALGEAGDDPALLRLLAEYIERYAG